SFIYDRFLSENYHLAYFHENVCCLSDRPSFIKRDNQFNLHNESGPSIEYRDGWKLWYIHGISVDEQIVLKPETQTIDQIDKENNSDVRSIRMERFGLLRYIKETNSSLLESRHDPITNLPEGLYQTHLGEKMLVVGC